MKKLISVAVASVFVLTGCFGFGGGESESDGTKIVLNTESGIHEYIIEVADTKEKRSVGLMNRESLDEDKGMIFIYAEDRRPAFWMKNTLIPLDMIFINSDFKVVDFFEYVPPCEADPCPHYIPSADATYVLELSAGQSNKIALNKGDSVDY